VKHVFLFTRQFPGGLSSDGDQRVTISAQTKNPREEKKLELAVQASRGILGELDSDNSWDIQESVLAVLKRLRTCGAVVEDISFDRKVLPIFMANILKDLERDHPGTVITDGARFADIASGNGFALEKIAKSTLAMGRAHFVVVGENRRPDEPNVVIGSVKSYEAKLTFHDSLGRQYEREFSDEYQLNSESQGHIARILKSFVTGGDVFRETMRKLDVYWDPSPIDNIVHNRRDPAIGRLAEAVVAFREGTLGSFGPAIPNLPPKSFIATNRRGLAVNIWHDTCPYLATVRLMGNEFSIALSDGQRDWFGRLHGLQVWIPNDQNIERTIRNVGEAFWRLRDGETNRELRTLLEGYGSPLSVRYGSIDPQLTFRRFCAYTFFPW